MTPKSKDYVVFPAQGGSFSIALQDVIAAFERSSVWIHSGWIDVVWKFRRTRIGPFWHTLNLAAFVIVMGVIWSKVLNQNPVEHFRYVGTNLIIWTLIASFITDGTGIIISGQSTALSMRFPYVAFALGHAWRTLLLFCHHIVLYIGIIVGTLHMPGWQILLFFPALLLLLANGVWMSLLAGMICLKWRDVAPAVGSGMQIMMFVTPVFWPKDLLGPELAYAVDLNPLYHFVRLLRDPMLGAVSPLTTWLWVLGTLVVGSIVTMWIYGRYRDRFAYWY